MGKWKPPPLSSDKTRCVAVLGLQLNIQNQIRKSTHPSKYSIPPIMSEGWERVRFSPNSTILYIIRSYRSTCKKGLQQIRIKPTGREQIVMLISSTIEGIKILSLEENKRTSFNYVSWVQNFNTLQSSDLNNRVKLQFFLGSQRLAGRELRNERKQRGNQFKYLLWKLWTWANNLFTTIEAQPYE